MRMTTLKRAQVIGINDTEYRHYMESKKKIQTLQVFDLNGVDLLRNNFTRVKINFNLQKARLQLLQVTIQYRYIMGFFF